MKTLVACLLFFGTVAAKADAVACKSKEIDTACVKRVALASGNFTDEIKRLEATFKTSAITVQPTYKMGDGGWLGTRFVVVVPLLTHSDLYFEKAVLLKVEMEEDGSEKQISSVDVVHFGFPTQN